MSRVLPSIGYPPRGREREIPSISELRDLHWSSPPPLPLLLSSFNSSIVTFRFPHCVFMQPVYPSWLFSSSLPSSLQWIREGKGIREDNNSISPSLSPFHPSTPFSVLPSTHKSHCITVSNSFLFNILGSPIVSIYRFSHYCSLIIITWSTFREVA